MNGLALAAAAAFLLCSGSSPAQQGFPALTDTDAPGLHILNEKSYDGTSLWGYINGGADVYLEYGFSQLLARKAQADGATYRIDLYRMRDPASAFGIFSISTATCSSGDSLDGRHCISRYQIQAARGDFYLSVANDKGTPEAGRTGLTIARRLLSQIADSDPGIPSVFAIPVLRTLGGSVKFMKGRLGIENGFPAWEELFSGCSAYSAHILPVLSDTVELSLAHIAFGIAREADGFSSAAGFQNLPSPGSRRRETEGAIRCLWRLSDTRIVYLEAGTGYARMDAIVSAVDAFLTH